MRVSTRSSKISSWGRGGRANCLTESMWMAPRSIFHNPSGVRWMDILARIIIDRRFLRLGQLLLARALLDRSNQ